MQKHKARKWDKICALCLWNLWLATKLLPSNKDYPSICPHPFEYRLLAFSAASLSGPQWKEDSLCRCVPHPQPLTNGSIKAAILLSVRRLCSGCISRHQARPSSLLYKINKLIIVFRLVCLHCSIYFVWKQCLLPTAGLQWEFICSLLLVTEASLNFLKAYTTNLALQQRLKSQ